MLKKTKCSTKYCRNKCKENYCSTCRSRKCREKNPIKYAFNSLKWNAKLRGVAFSLTFEEFSEFCIATSYIAGKNRRSEGYSIDRISNDIGYCKENIRILPFGENARKKQKMLSYDYEHKWARVFDVTTHPSKDDIF